MPKGASNFCVQATAGVGLGAVLDSALACRGLCGALTHQVAVCSCSTASLEVQLDVLPED